ncbi:MAG: hypothetical protein ABIN58_13125, partial [candidate division WOR-3 bacterium]
MVVQFSAQTTSAEGTPREVVYTVRKNSWTYQLTSLSTIIAFLRASGENVQDINLTMFRQDANP